MDLSALTQEELDQDVSVGGSLLYRRERFITPEFAEELIEAFSPHDDGGADRIADRIVDRITWSRRQVNVYGWKDERRLTAFYGDEGTSYRYSGRDNPCLPWTAHLDRVREGLASVLAGIESLGALKGQPPNFCLMNYYANGGECIGKHADDERDLLPVGAPIIASVSLGADRPLRFSRMNAEPVDVAQPSGTLVVMGGRTQQVWKHEVPPTKRAIAPRINLTFRYVKKR